MSTAVFEARNLTKQYGNSFALHQIDMKIEKGDIYGFVGENGAGKTTLMNIIGGLVRPTAGSIALFGKSAKQELDYARQHIGILIEMPALYPDLSAYENLSFYCRIYGITNEGARITDVLHMVGLSDVANKKTSEYSLGMRQRLGLAIALLNKPKFLVLDEPINGLDPSGIVELRKILEGLAKEKGVTIMLSSHFLNELQLLATKIGFIHKGRLMKEMAMEELLRSAETRICIQTPDQDAAVQIIKNKLQIEDVRIMDDGEIQIAKESIELEKLMSALLEQDVQFKNIRLSAPNLENYYMDLIGGKHS